MAKAKRISNSGMGTPHVYCKPDKEVIKMLNIKFLLGMKEVTVDLPTFFNPMKKKKQQMYIGNNYDVWAECPMQNFNHKQGSLHTWKFIKSTYRYGKTYV
ncbi:hypothetical protein MIF8_32 [Erwinia phage MIF8]